MTVPALFKPLTLRSLELQHRGWVSPMCQYSCDPGEAPGVPNDWHLMHLGSFAAGGAALILTEAAAVNAEGRISPRDAGLYNDEQAAGWERIVRFVHRHGVADAKIGAQLAHAGRKASTYWPFSGRRRIGSGVRRRLGDRGSGHRGVRRLRAAGGHDRG